MSGSRSGSTAQTTGEEKNHHPGIWQACDTAVCLSLCSSASEPTCEDSSQELQAYTLCQACNNSRESTVSLSRLQYCCSGCHINSLLQCPPASCALASNSCGHELSMHLDAPSQVRHLRQQSSDQTSILTAHSYQYPLALIGPCGVSKL